MVFITILRFSIFVLLLRRSKLNNIRQSVGVIFNKYEGKVLLSSVQKHVDFALSNKVTVRECKLNNGLQWAHYTNEYDRLRYCNESQHTLSMYFRGGIETFRTDANSGFGGPGKFCLLPKGAESCWQLGSSQEFIHLYFDDDYIKQLGTEVLDLDPRKIVLPEQIYCENNSLQALYDYQIQHVNWFGEEPLAIKQLTDTVLVALLQSLKLNSKTGVLKGGLAPKVLSQVIDYIHANFHQKLLLADLAMIAGLSEYHFCRMFKQSTAYTPQAYLTKIRVEYAQRLLKQSSHSLAEIALACGFNNQSHLGKQFKSEFGVTPAKYRKSQS